MLNKKLIVALLAVVILFLGIFSFAQSNNSDEKDKTPSTSDEDKTKDNSGEQPTVGDETDNQDGTDIVVPARNNVGRTAVVADTTDPVITLNGDAEITVDLNQSYTDAGATATDNVTANVVVTATSTVNTSTAGVYQVLYTATDGAGNTASKIRTVKVRPLIIQPSNYSHEVNTPLDEDALAATLVLGPEATTSMGPANIDTINVNVLGDYVLRYTYEYTSEAGNVNAAVKYMTVSVVDTTKPVITLNKNDKGKADLVYEVDKTNANQYIELGATLTDNYDSNSDVTDITIEKKNNDDSWTKVDSIDTSVISEYRVKYNGKDSNNNSATEVVRSVKVVDSIKPEVVSITQKYESKQDGRIKTTIVFSEPIKSLGSDWQVVSDTTFVYYYYRTKTVTLSFEDLAGNKNTRTFSVDKTAPTGVISYSPTALTNGNVIATLQTTEPVKDITGWSRETDTIFKKEYTSNADETINFEDLIGNPGNSTLSIKNIDRVNPDIQIKSAPDSIGSISDKVFNKVSFKLHDDRLVKETILNDKLKTYTPNNWSDLNGVKVGSEGGVYGKNVLTLRDVAGNETAVEFYLDNVAPTVTVKSDFTGSLSHKIFSNVNFNLSDEYKIKEFVLNGKLNSVTPVTSLDINNITVGDTYGGTYGKNTLILRDLVGNETTYEFYLDNVGPTITVKPESIGSINDKVFSKVSFKLYDEYNVSDSKLNNSSKQYTISQWSDLNDVIVGSWQGGIYGENTLVLRDLAGNATTYKFYLDNEKPVISVVSPNRYPIEIGTSYIDKGYSATDGIDGDLTSKVVVTYRYNNHGNWQVKPTVDTTLFGEWTVWYGVTDRAGNVANRATRTFDVVDTTKPVVTLKEGDKVVEINTTFTDPGVTITDNSNEVLNPILTVYYSTTGADGTWVDATNNRVDTSKLGKYAIWYGTKDSSNNVADAVRRYVTVVDTTKPVVTLKEGDKVVEINTAFVDPGVTITDNSNEKIFPSLTVYYSTTGADGTWVGAPGNKVDTSKLGKYAIWYGTKDSSNNVADAVRRYVTVVDTTKPVVTLKEGDKVVEINTAFVDPGVTITDNSNEVLNPILTVYYSKTGADETWVGAVDNKVDTSKLGKYAVWYGAKDSSNNSATTVRRYVTVVDTTKPVVTLKEGDKVVEINTAFTDPGVTITDNSNEVLNPIFTVYYSKTGADGTWVGAPSNKVDTSKLGKYAVWYGAKDSSNNSATTVRRYVTVVDTTKPLVTLKEGDKVVEINTAFTDPGVTITDNSNEVLNPILTVYYSTTGADGTWVGAPSNKVDTSKLGKYAIWYGAKDSSNNVADAVRRYVTIVDTTIPTIDTVSGNPSDWTKNDVTLTVTATDNNKIFQYSFDNGQTWQNENTKVFSSNQDVTILVKDESGNTSNAYVEHITKIDKSAPSLKVEDPNQSYAPAKSFSRKVTVSDSASGLDDASLKYLWSTSRDASLPLVSTTGTSFKSGDNVTSPVGVTGKYYLLIEVKDNAGNKSIYMSWGFDIDNTLPQINSVSGNPSSWTNQDVTLTINATDNSNVMDTNAYSFDNGQTWQSENTKVFSSNHDVTMLVKDNAGNISNAYVEHITKMDKSAPSLKVEDPNQSYAPARSFSRKVTVSDSASGLDDASLKYLWSTSRDASLPLVSTTGTSFKSGDSVTSPVGVTGKYYLLIEVKDNAGNKSIYMSWGFDIDNDLPQINSVSGNPNSWTNQDVTLTVNATDSTGSLEYSFDNGTNWQSENTKVFSSNQDVNILVRDAVGNVSNTYIERISMIDKELPVVNSVSGNSAVWTNSDVTLTVSASDNVGITQYSFDNGTNWQNTNTLTFTGNANPAILVKDAAGNVSLVYNEAITKIDKTAPSLTVTQPEEDMIIFDADYISSFAISGTDSLSGIRVIKYAKGLYTIDSFPAGASVVPASGIITGVAADEIYTIYAEDNVGNKVVATKTVTNILGSDDTKNINDLQINVGTRKWRASGYYRQLQVKTLGATKIVSFDQRVGYLPLSAFSGVPVTRDVNTLTEDIERDWNTNHTVYLKDSTGKEYVIWVEIVGALGE